jgi:hypothetical protein
LKLCFDHDASQAHAAYSCGKPFDMLARRALNDLAVRAEQLQPSDVVSERALDMMILSMHVVGDGTTDRDELSARRYSKHPPPGNDKLLNIAQQNTSLASQVTTLLVEVHKVVEPPCVPQNASRIEAHITIATRHTERNARLVQGQNRRYRIRIAQAHHLVQVRVETPP